MGTAERDSERRMCDAFTMNATERSDRRDNPKTLEA